jgi:hypothetical protein
MRNKAVAIESFREMTETRANRRQLSGQSPAALASSGPLWIGSFILMIACVGCGGSGYNPNNVTVTVSPATGTVAENGQEPLRAALNTYCSGCAPLMNWSVTENTGANCTWVEAPPPRPCPAGTLQVTEFVGSLTATYFAPSTSGIYHVVAYAVISPTVSKEGTSVVTVSP